MIAEALCKYSDLLLIQELLWSARRDIHDQGGAQAIQVPNCTTGNCSSHKIKALLNGNAISVKLLANLQDIPRRESRVNLGEGHVDSRIQVGLNSDLYMSTVHS